MKPVTPAQQAAHTGPVQRPGLLVEIHFSTVRRWSSRGQITWGGYTWAPRDVRADSLRVQPLQVAGTLLLAGAEATALVLAEGVQDRLVRLYSFDAGVPGEALWLCDAVGAGAQVGDGVARVSLRHRAEYTASPRVYVTPAAGFTHLQPAGTVLRINGMDYRLERPATS
jgi:hypothetical protein